MSQIAQPSSRKVKRVTKNWFIPNVDNKIQKCLSMHMHSAPFTNGLKRQHSFKRHSSRSSSSSSSSSVAISPVSQFRTYSSTPSSPTPPQSEFSKHVEFIEDLSLFRAAKTVYEVASFAVNGLLNNEIPRLALVWFIGLYLGVTGRS